MYADACPLRVDASVHSPESALVHERICACAGRVHGNGQEQGCGRGGVEEAVFRLGVVAAGMVEQGMKGWQSISEPCHVFNSVQIGARD